MKLEILRNRTFWMWLCVIGTHRCRRTMNEFQNSTEISRTCVRFHSVRSVDVNLRDLPTIWNWTISGCTHMNLNNIPNLEGFLSDPESIVLLVWNETRRALSGTWTRILVFKICSYVYTTSDRVSKTYCSWKDEIKLGEVVWSELWVSLCPVSSPSQTSLIVIRLRELLSALLPGLSYSKPCMSIFFPLSQNPNYLLACEVV